MWGLQSQQAQFISYFLCDSDFLSLSFSKFQVQELHEEEAQWVNYNEDELCVKMQLADGIFETLIRDTIDVLNQISEKQGRILLV